ncbi:MAG TPA: hypothetical protein VFQ37_06485 [Mycobacterium sp.]|nr:hypothetical protein [Mycobacterium sp.]
MAEMVPRDPVYELGVESLRNGYSAGVGRSMTALRWIRTGWGALLLLVPNTVASHTPAGSLDARARLVGRILGARHLVQAWYTGADPSGRRLAVGAGVDGLHATSMLSLAALSPRHRRPALADAAAAAGFAAAGILSARRDRGRPA